MNCLPVMIVAAASGAGLMLGWSGRQWQMVDSSERSDAGMMADVRPGTSRIGRLRPSTGDGPSSAENLEAMVALLDAGSAEPAHYERLALCLLDADAEEIAALWSQIDKPDRLQKETIDLIFVFWTRLDPDAAISASAGTPFEGYAWWAWACHDPRRALDEAALRNPKCLSNVGWGIGEFHPQWLLDHHEDLPYEARIYGSLGISKWLDGLDPLELLASSRATGVTSYDFLYRAVRVDPEAAWAWIKEKDSVGSDSMARVASIMSEFHPEVLAKILHEPEAAELRRHVEEQGFQRLLAEDPAAAVAEAESTKEPRLATSRLTAAGLQVVGKDPEAAFRLAQRMLELDPDALFDRALRPGERSEDISRGENKEARRLMTALIARDPERVMAMLPQKDEMGRVVIFKTWASWDPVEYAEWVNAEADSSFRNQAAQVLISHLIQERDFREAAEWSLSLENPSVVDIQTLFERWGRKNRFAAEAWLEAADLPDAMKQEIRNPVVEGR